MLKQKAGLPDGGGELLYALPVVPYNAIGGADGLPCGMNGKVDQERVCLVKCSVPNQEAAARPQNAKHLARDRAVVVAGHK